jgi:hypothetical protein
VNALEDTGEGEEGGAHGPCSDIPNRDGRQEKQRDDSSVDSSNEGGAKEGWDTERGVRRKGGVQREVCAGRVWRRVYAVE